MVASGRSLEESAVRELATGEVFTATRGKELGLVDDFGGFAEALDIAAQLGDARPRPLWVRPKRPFSARLLGRANSQQAGISVLANQFQRLMGGGFYFLEPSYLIGDYKGSRIRSGTSTIKVANYGRRSMECLVENRTQTLRVVKRSSASPSRHRRLRRALER